MKPSTTAAIVLATAVLIFAFSFTQRRNNPDSQRREKASAAALAYAQDTIKKVMVTPSSVQFSRGQATELGNGVWKAS